MHTALDSLLALEAIRRADPELGQIIGASGRELDENGAPFLDAVFDSGDKLAAIKALSLVYGRVDIASLGSHENIERYWPKVAELADPETATAESGAFYRNMLDTLSDSPRLLNSLLQSLGYENPYLIRDVWIATDLKAPDLVLVGSRDRVKANIRTMLILETQEPGLCRKITDEFNIINFARYHPDMLKEMYRAKIEEPEKPYVLSLSAMTDHNGALSTYQSMDDRQRIQKKLAKQGIRFEEHECGTELDIEKAIQKAVEAKREHGSLITDLLIDGHGSSLGIHLADLGVFTPSNAYMLVGRVQYLSKLSPALHPKARAIIRSCSAGKEEDGRLNIAEDIAQTIGRQAVASGFNASSVLRVNSRGGRTKVEPRFRSRKHAFAVLPVIAIPFVGFRIADRISHSFAKRTFSPGEAE